MKKLILLLTLVLSFSANAQNAELFEKGNDAYAAGNFEEAVENYEQVLANGETSAALHYNLANAYYRLNRVAPSIYHYEKALQLNPGDEDARNNLVFARNMAIDAIGEETRGGFWGIFSRSTSAFSASGWAWVAIFCMLLFVVAFLAYYFSQRTIIKRIMFIGSMFFLVLAVASSVVGFTKASLDQESSYAIVFAEQVEVKSEPSPRAGDAFMLHEGAKVKITEDFREWVEIELPNGSSGWMRATDLKKL